jgi:hypothetical protein
MKKLKKVEYFCIEGKLKACELYEDDSIRLVEVNNGITKYILTGKSKGKKSKSNNLYKQIIKAVDNWYSRRLSNNDLLHSTTVDKLKSDIKDVLVGEGVA